MSGALARVGLQLWIVLFIVFFGAEVIHLEPGLRVLTQLLYGVPIAAWAAWRLRGPRDLLDWMVLAALAWYAVACLLSRDRTESLGTLALATAFAAWFLLMRRIAGTELRATIVSAGATGLVLTLAYNAFLLVQEKVAWYASYGSAPFEGLVTFPWESVNALPVLVLLAIPFLAWLPRTPARGIAIGLVALSALVVVPLSLGRAGWLGLAVAGGLVAAVLAWPRLDIGRRRLAIGGALVAIPLVAVVIGPRLTDSLGESGRTLLWQQGLAMVANAPIAGSGPGTYSWARLAFEPANADLLAVRLVHNAYLQTLVDGGAVAALAIGGVVVTAALSLRRRLPLSRADTVAAACLLGYLAALTLDDFSYLPAITATSVTVAGFLVPIRPDRATTSPRVPFLLPLALAAAAAGGMPGVVAVDTARTAAQAARSAMVDGRAVDAVEAFTRATRAHPEHAGYWLGLGMATDETGDADGAIHAYERAVAANPGDPRGYGGLAALSGEAERTAWLVEASRRTLGEPTWDLALGARLLADGADDDAIRALGRAVALRPSALAEVGGLDGVDVDAVIGEAIRILATGLRPSSAQTAANTWDLQLARGDLGADAGPEWRAVEAAVSGDLDGARALADQALAAAPHVALGYQALAAVARFACDEALEREALAREVNALGAYAVPEHEPVIRREFVYREASLGLTQPLSQRLTLPADRWPWPFVDRPACP